MTDCKHRWLDVFVTKPELGQDKKEYDFDDQFVCSVQSVRIDPSDLTTAIVVDTSSDWIMPTWSEYYDKPIDGHPEAYSAFKNIKRGDLIRVGQTSSTGYTDYLTVVDIQEISKIYNGTHYKLPITRDPSVRVEHSDNTVAGTTSDASGSNTQNYIDMSTASTPRDTYWVPLKNGIAHYAFRLNLSLNCTSLPSSLPIDVSIKTSVDASGNYADTQKATLARRNRVTMPLTLKTRDDEVNFFPMYTTKRWLSDTTLRAALDHGVKQVSCIKLMGYSVANKRQVGLQHAHEVQADDYVILRINEIEGHVISNNRFANGSFAVLYVGSTSDNEVGAIEYNRFDTVSGIVTQDIDATNSVIRNLTLDITDRLGRAAHFGRLHLWFKLRVTHG